MSRIYTNQALSNLPVHNVTWNGSWDHSSQVATAKSNNNAGVLLEGTLAGKARISISDTPSASTKVRYYVLYLTIERAHSRKFDDKGKEVEPNFSETTKVSTGYLNSSYDTKAKGSSDRLTVEAVKSSLSASPVNALLQKLPSGPSNAVALFMRESDLDKVELPVDAVVRLKTVGSSPFVESLVVKDEISGTRANCTGDQTMGGNWTDKILAMKAGGEGEREEDPPEIADDEWDD